MAENNKEIEQLNELIKIANDGKCGYENAAKDVNDATLKELFTQYSNERASMIVELKNEVLNLGGNPEAGGDTVGVLHRTWMDIKSTVTGGNPVEVLQTCITGEEAAVKAYNDILNDSQSNNLISRHLTTITTALTHLRALEKSASS